MVSVVLILRSKFSFNLVPRLVSSTGRVEYASPGQTLSLEVEFEGHGISSVEWRQNDLETLPDGVETNTSDDFTTSEIRIASFEPESHSGIYKFLVTNPAGISVLTFWELQQAGNCNCTSAIHN